MKITNNLKLYCKSMGKIFRVKFIAKDIEEANRFMLHHPDTGMIAEERKSGLIFIAELYQITVPSNTLPD